MFVKESQFEKTLLEILDKDRKDIVSQFRPFNSLRLTVDIKSNYNNLEEWRELKIIYYKDDSNSIQNLWKGIGKTRLMQKLSEKLLINHKIPISTILTIPNFDFDQFHKDIREAIIELVPIELLNYENILIFVKSTNTVDSHE